MRWIGWGLGLNSVAPMMGIDALLHEYRPWYSGGRRPRVARDFASHSGAVNAVIAFGSAAPSAVPVFRQWALHSPHTVSASDNFTCTSNKY